MALGPPESARGPISYSFAFEDKDEISRSEIAVAVPIAFGPCGIIRDGVFILGSFEDRHQIARVEYAIKI